MQCNRDEAAHDDDTDDEGIDLFGDLLFDENGEPNAAHPLYPFTPIVPFGTTTPQPLDLQVVPRDATLVKGISSRAEPARAALVDNIQVADTDTISRPESGQLPPKKRRLHTKTAVADTAYSGGMGEPPGEEHGSTHQDSSFESFFADLQAGMHSEHATGSDEAHPASSYWQEPPSRNKRR